jgi:hypothetical protein
MTSPRGLLENRTALSVAVLFCLVECVWSWLLITRHVRLPQNPVNVFGLVHIFVFVFLIFVTVSIAYRSSFWGDRLVFGAVADVSVLIAIKATVPLTRLAMLAVNVAKSSMWTIAALVSLIVLVRSFGTSAGGPDVKR